MSHPSTKNIAGVTLIVGSIFLWTWLLFEFGATEMVDVLGIKNGYLVMTLVALFGGVTSITGVTYVATILTLASAGFNPIGLAVASGIGISIGDTVYYYLGRYGLRELSTGRLATRIQKATSWLSERSKITRFAAIYIYTAFSPFPNDILTILLGVARQPVRLVIPALVLGNSTFTFIIASFGQVLPFT